jgi:hypothetical protein
MWALIKNDKVQEIIRFPKSIVIDDIKYPPNIFRLWNWTDLNAIGIYQLNDTGTKGNNDYENTSDPTYTYSKSNKNVTTSYTVTSKSLTDTTTSDKDYKGNAVIVLGLKSQAKNKAKATADKLIKRFNWLVERFVYDSSKTIPNAVKTYVAAIRTDCAAIETAIDDASDLSAFKSLHVDELNDDGSLKAIARVNRWTDDYDVKGLGRD